LLDRIKYIDKMRSVGADRCYSDACPSVQLEMINFGDTEIESPTHVGDQRTY